MWRSRTICKYIHSSVSIVKKWGDSKGVSTGAFISMYIPMQTRTCNCDCLHFYTNSKSKSPKMHYLSAREARTECSSLSPESSPGEIYR